MDNYILNDGSIIEIEESNDTYSFKKKFATAEEYLSTLYLLKRDNLLKYQLQTSAGTICANPENKECLSHLVHTEWDKDGNITAFDVQFYITDIDLVKARLDDLEETTDILTAHTLGV